MNIRNLKDIIAYPIGIMFIFLIVIYPWYNYIIYPSPENISELKVMNGRIMGRVSGAVKGSLML